MPGSHAPATAPALARRLAAGWRAFQARLLQTFRYRRSTLSARVAPLYRRALRRVVVVAVTGSVGKTTTKELADRVLASRFVGRTSPQSYNRPLTLGRTILSVRPGDGYCVLELGANGPGSLARSVRITRPRIAVVTNVLTDHCQTFHTLEATAAEKVRVVAALPRDGTAVLNVDDPLVLGMAARCKGRVLTFGLAAGADVRARDVTGAWPGRLELTVEHAGGAFRLRTRLCGTHWTHALLAALAVGVAAGVPIAEGVRALAGVEPAERRLSPVVLPGGVTVLRDDFKSARSTIPAALAVLREARAARKVFVMGTIRQFQGLPEPVWAETARLALAVADHVFFVGPNAHLALAGRRHPHDEALRAFRGVAELTAFLRGFAAPGDLILLKGHYRVDRLERVLEAWPEAAAAPG